LLQTPLTLGVQALPLFISSDLGGKLSDAGLVLGLCAALEIPLMLIMGALTARIPLRRLVLAGSGCGVAYYALATATTGLPLLAAAQLVNAVFIAAVSGLGISYMQELLPRYPGRATTLFSNTFPVGAMLAGPLFGLAQHFGFRLAYATGTVLSAAGLVVLVLTRPDAWN
jgi:SET family sugar efflux transporter-like MFS transporter